MKAYETKIKDLPHMNRMHLAWRLDHKTVVGYLTACAIARADKHVCKDWTLLELFMWAGRSEASAKIHSKKVVDYRVPRAARCPNQFRLD